MAEEVEPDWLIRIDTNRSYCIYLVGGLHGTRRRGSEDYECSLIENKDGRCRERFCPIKRKKEDK